jgi:tetratricopeptide (TPR) repeat protein
VPFAIGLIYQYLGDHADALRYYEQSLQLFGENVTTFCNMATCLIELDDVDLAKVLAQKALQLDDEDTEVLALAQRLDLPDSAESASDLQASIA